MTQIHSRNSSITLRGFKPDNIYRFYCVRASEQGIYSRSIDINCDASMYNMNESICTRYDNTFRTIT